jgi:thiamine-monophosphate kinase
MKKQTLTSGQTLDGTPGDSLGPTLGALGENALVERIARWMSLKPGEGRQPDTQRPPWASQKILASIGDDTAVIQLGGKAAPRLALTTDLLVEGTHFLSTHPARALGAKAVEVNLSDLAAAGAWPAWILVSLGAPANLSSVWIEALYAGMRDALTPYGCPCLGGDTVRSERLVLNIVAGGFLMPGVEAPLRNRAQMGQSLYVTGTLGDSLAGLQLLLQDTESEASDLSLNRTTPGKRGTESISELSPRDRAFLVRRHQCPQARVAVGGAIARLCPDAAMMDLSDGLACDLPRLARASRCGFEVSLTKLPLSPALRRYAAASPITPEQMALTGGEDYELLFSTAEPFENWREAVVQAAGSRKLRITRIGKVTAESEGIRYLDRQGKAILPVESGFLHFSEEEFPGNK